MKDMKAAHIVKTILLMPIIVIVSFAICLVEFFSEVITATITMIDTFIGYIIESIKELK